MDLLIYFGKVNVYWILFYACYWLLFRKHTFFLWNRFYLIGSLLISFALPLIHFPDSSRVMPTAVYAVSVIPVYITRPESTKFIIHWTQFIWAIQFIGATLMLLKLAEGFKELFKLIDQGETIPLEDHTLVLLPHNEIGSFSFMKWLVVNFADYEQHFDPILRHESVHIRQLHSLDILLIEILKVIFWFNPVLWFYKRSFQEVHEYLADEEAPNRDHYARFLVAYALNAPIASLTNHFFNSSLLKSRIQMIYKNRNSQWALGKYFMIFPVIGIVVMLTAARERLLSAVERNNFEVVHDNITVEGKVRDENGNAIESASVIIKGKTIGTITDMYGKFEISDLTMSDSLVISHIGYESIIIDVKNTKLNYITLRKKDNKLEKVVVMPSQINDNNSAVSAISTTKTGEFDAVEVMPEFPGGETAMSHFLYNNIVYPYEAANDGVQGEVGVSFIVNENGYIRNPKIIKGIGAGLDEEALRVVLKMPRWEPGKQNGEALPVRYNLNITFVMESGTDKKPGQMTDAGKSAKYQSEYGLAETVSNQNVATKLKSQNNTARTFRGQPGMNLGVIMPHTSGQQEFVSTSAETILPKQNPILILDGKISDDPDLLKKIKSDDIQSISVLTNETATSAYGPKGKNGVFIINTKKK